jgi:hypothetical protein
MLKTVDELGCAAKICEEHVDEGGRGLLRAGLAGTYNELQGPVGVTIAQRGIDR